LINSHHSPLQHTRIEVNISAAKQTLTEKYRWMGNNTTVI